MQSETKEILLSHGTNKNISEVEAYLENTVSESLKMALLEVGKERPKYPFATLEQSANTFMALYLKSQNPLLKKDVRNMYKEKMKQFLDTCESLHQLKKEMDNGYVDIQRSDLYEQLKEFCSFEH